MPESSIELTEDIQSGPPVWFKWVRPFTRSKWTPYGVTLAGFTTILAVVFLRRARTSVPAIVGPPTGAPTIFPEDILPGNIVGVEEAKPNAWPWQVSLQHPWQGEYYHDCGAVLLGTRWAMTAAHCVDRRWRHPETFRAVFGEHDLNIESGREQVVHISKVHFHPLWNGILSNGYDVALLEFDSEVTLNQFVQPAALPPAGQILPHNYTCKITGWQLERFSARLHQAFHHVVDHKTCSRPDWRGHYVKTSMMCAGGNGVDVDCSLGNRMGDIGSPLNCEVNGIYVVHGVVSWEGGGCNSPKKPTVYTRVSDLIEWFNSIMN